MTKELLYKLYIEENLTKTEIAKRLGTYHKKISELLKEYNITKSKEQYKQSRKESIKRKYGVENISQLQSVKDKKKNSSIDKYGTEYTFQAEEVKEKSRKTKLEKYGDEYYNNDDKHKETCQAKYGVNYYWQSEEARQEYRERNKRREAGFGCMRFKNTIREKYGVDNISQAPHIARKKSKKYKSEDGLTFDSSWELLVYNYCKRNNLEVERNIPIEYNYNNKKHTTFIDFRIDGYLFEVKGEHLLKGCFDYADNMVPISEKLKVYKENKVIIITNYKDLFGKANSTKSNGFKYPNKCKDPLIGVDISLFDNPDFPYREDRPKCFYDVRVDNNRSSYEAFQDESLRWEMIKNRIEYAGGFINNKAILNAMNITRKCKQPSWFSKKFAKELITKYVTTDTVVDPFAGWGARNDACKELGINYIGIDFNKELVDWHKSCKRNIEYGDANTFTYNGECSVLICPPYQDVETYFEGQDLKTTQCEWLEIVMKNIPNAKEYIMVCKVVDKGWEKYIIETKGNKSHFGTNNEYVLKVNNYGAFII